MRKSALRPDFTHTGQIPLASSWPELVSKEEQDLLAGELEERYGIPTSVLSEYMFFKRKKGWWILKKSEWIRQACSLKVSVVGLRAFHRVGRYIKPTTRFVQLFGHLATKSIVVLSEQEMFELVCNKKLGLNLDLEDGYVILKLHSGQTLGIGLWIRGMLQSQIPRKEIRWNYRGKLVIA